MSPCGCSSKAAGLLRQQLQGSQQVQTALIAPSRVHADQPRVKLEVEPQQIEECMDTFLNVAEDFDRLFHQACQMLNSCVLFCCISIVYAAVCAVFTLAYDLSV